MQNRINTIEKIKNVKLFFILLFVSVLVALVVSKGSILIGVGILALFVGLAVLLPALTNLKFGLILVIIISFLFNGIKRVIWKTDVPLGTLVDGMLIILMTAVLFKSGGEGKYKVLTNFFSVMIIAYFFYNVLELFNPIIASRTAWFATVRGLSGFILVYFIACDVIDDLKTALTIIKLLIFMALLMALYGLYQEFFGYLQFEKDWIASDPKNAGLFFTFGAWRRFSFLSDPMSFGIMMAYTGIMCIVLMFGPFSKKTKTLLGIAAFLMLWAMIYTGTRTAYFLIPTGFLFFSIITVNRNILVFSTIVIVIAAAIILSPTENKRIKIIQTAFVGEKDASFMVRVRSRAFIKPIIQNHPFGSGLGSTGAFGKKYNPNSVLAKFQPDSEYVRIAVEQGWIGLSLYLLMFFAALKVGIDNYFIVVDPKIKIIYVALLSSILMIIAANYPQEVMQFTAIIYMGVSIALLTKLKDFDPILNKPKVEEED